MENKPSSIKERKCPVCKKTFLGYTTNQLDNMIEIHTRNIHKTERRKK